LHVNGNISETDQNKGNLERKFCSRSLPVPKKIEFGKQTDATKGINALLGISTEEAEELKRQGKNAIISEIKQLVMHSKKGSKEREQADEIDEYLSYILEKKSDYKKCKNGFMRDYGRTPPMKFNDFMEKDEAKNAGLTSAEVLALRLYTTPAFRVINDPLRDETKRKGNKHPMPATVININKGILKMRQLAGDKKSLATAKETKSNTSNKSSAKNSVLWRGMQKIALTEEFIKHGGTELAPMSTTSELSIACKYGACEMGSVLFKITVQDCIQHGATLKWLSVFPTDEEILYPPLTFLRPNINKELQKVLGKNGVEVTIIEVMPEMVSSC
jgi:hypothetical protein